MAETLEAQVTGGASAAGHVADQGRLFIRPPMGPRVSDHLNPYFSEHPRDPVAIPYAWCPHVIEGDSRTANAFCMICMAFICWECHECHPYEHRNVKQS